MPWLAFLQFGLEMIHLECHLPMRHFDGGACGRLDDFATVELILAACGFLVNRHQIGRNGARRRFTPPKPRELRVIDIAFGFTVQHMLREQRFTPKRKQALAIKKSWVQ